LGRSLLLGSMPTRRARCSLSSCRSICSLRTISTGIDSIRYRTACEQVIFADFEYALAKDVQNRLWNTHARVNGNYRKELKYVRRLDPASIGGRSLTLTELQLRRKSKEHIVEYRKLSKSYLLFIKASQKFYRQYILNLDTQFDGIAELRKIAHSWKNEGRSPLEIAGPTNRYTAPANAQRKRLSPSLKEKVLLSCYQTLIYLGDLSRYRETELNDKTRNWGPAVGYYDLARELYPDSGHAHNQLAVIAQADGNHFRSTYHLYRSLASKQPHPQARPNLELDFKKIAAAWDKGELINAGHGSGKAVVAWFTRLHSKLYKGIEFRGHDELENEVLSQITIEIKEQSLDSVLQKMILINMSAEYFATIQMQGMS
jgi:hypothetical protein